MSLALRFPLEWFRGWCESSAVDLDIRQSESLRQIMLTCWRVPGCTMPNDPAWIARKLKMGASEYDDVAAPLVRRFFRLNGKRRLLNDGLSVQYLKAKQAHDARAKAGRARARARSLKRGVERLAA